MKLYKNRIVIIVFCLILAGTFMFLYSNSLVSQNKTVQVVIVDSEIKKGTLITENMLSTKQIGGFNLSNKVIKDKADVINKYALSDFSKEDVILKDKITSEIPLGNQKLEQLNGTQIAISISIKNLAAGLSDKLQSGDIVSCIITNDTQTITPLELTYVEVLTTTYATGIDKDVNANSDENIATVTLLVTPKQAELLANYNQMSLIHLALVYRGDSEQAKAFLNKQSEVLENVQNNSSNGQ